MLPLAGISGIERDFVGQHGRFPGKLRWSLKIGDRRTLSIAMVKIDAAVTGAFGVGGAARRVSLKKALRRGKVAS